MVTGCNHTRCIIISAAKFLNVKELQRSFLFSYDPNDNQLGKNGVPQMNEGRVSGALVGRQLVARGGGKSSIATVPSTSDFSLSNVSSVPSFEARTIISMVFYTIYILDF